MKHVAVVGGGIAGLAAAHRVSVLSREQGKDVRVTLLESSERIGGKILTERIRLAGPKTATGDTLVLEGGPDSFITAKPHALDLIRELGLESHLVPTDKSNTDVFVFARGRLRRIPAGIFLMAPSRLKPFMESDFMTWRGKLRMGMDLFLPRGKSDDESMAAFARRRFGDEAVDVLVQPVMAGIYGGDAEALSMKDTFPRFLDLERKHRSILCGLRSDMPPPKNTKSQLTMFMTLSGGLIELVEMLASRLGPGVIRLDAPVSTVDRPGATWQINLATGKPLSCDAIVLATPAWQSAGFLRSGNPDLAAALGKIPFASTATLSFEYRKPSLPKVPAGFGFVVARSEFQTISAGTFTSSKFPERVPKGTVLLRCFLGGAGRESVLESSDADLIRRAREDLNRILGVNESPETSRLYRWPRANPQYLVGHGRLLAEIEKQRAQIGGLWLAGSSYYGVGIPDCIASGEAAAREVVKTL